MTNLIRPTLLVIALALPAGATSSEGATALDTTVAIVDANVSDRVLPFPRWETMSKALELGKRFPLLLVYAEDGRCVGKFEPQMGWKADSLNDPAVDNGMPCSAFLSEGPGSTAPKESRHRTAHLYLLDLPFCTACIAAEEELRQFVSREGGKWRLEITRVQEPTERIENAVCPLCGSEETPH